MSQPFDFIAMSEHLARELNRRREDFMSSVIRKIIGPRCPVAPEDMMTVLWFRGYEAQIEDQRGGEMRFVVTHGEERVFDAAMPSFQMPFGEGSSQ